VGYLTIASDGRTADGWTVRNLEGGGSDLISVQAKLGDNYIPENRKF
jgi:hypothetical protein